MKLKKLWWLLAILVVAVFTLTACSSSDDDNEQTGTFQYVISYSMFEGNYQNMQTVSNAFMQAFGVSSTPITLTGTRSECDRKAKEYAIKAQTALANEGSFGATVEFSNATTDEVILTFTIKKDNNGVTQKDDFWYITKYSSITFKNLVGKRLKIVSYKSGKIVYDSTIASDSETIQFDRDKDGRYFTVVMEGAKDFNFYLEKK